MSATKAGRCPTRTRRALSLAGLAWAPAWALAVESVGPQSSSWGALLQALLALVVVLLALFVFLWLLRRISPVQTGAQGAVRVVGGVMLGTRERLVIVEVADQWLLIGVAAGQVNHLHTMPRPAGYSAPEDTGAASGFAGKLAERLGRRERR
jgi:flagellar protein FliO/FliZ